MGISGNIKTMALAELLQWLSQGQKTGTLVIDGIDVKKRIFFEEGVIVSSASTDPKEYLGHFLTAHGYITEEEANSAVARQKEEKKLLGQILVGMGAITEEQLQEVLHLKSEESIYDIFTWDEGEFVFLDDELPVENFIRMSLDVQWIVLEGSRRMDEWKRVKEWIPSKLCVPVLVVDYEAMDIEEVDKRILAWVDDDRSIEDISHGAQTTLFMIAQTLSEYAQQGVIKVVRPRVIEVPVKSEAGDSSKAGAEAPTSDESASHQQMPQMPQGYPGMMPGQMMPGQMMPGQMMPGQMMPGQMMPGQMPMGYPGMQQQGYPMQQMPMGQPGFDPSGGMGGQGGGQAAGGGNVDVAGRTLHFAGDGGGAAPAQPSSEAEGLVMKAEDLLRQGELFDALESFRKAKTAQGSGPSIEQAVQEGEKKVGEALENAGFKLSAVPKLKCGMEELTQLEISPQEGFMLTRVDGSYDIQSILKMSPMPKIDAQILFWKLKKTGHVSI